MKDTIRLQSDDPCDCKDEWQYKTTWKGCDPNAPDEPKDHAYPVSDCVMDEVMLGRKMFPENEEQSQQADDYFQNRDKLCPSNPLRKMG